MGPMRYERIPDAPSSREFAEVIASVLLGVFVAIQVPLGLALIVAMSPLMVAMVLRWPRPDASLIVAGFLVWTGLGGRWALPVQVPSLAIVIVMAIYSTLRHNRVKAHEPVLGSALMLGGIIYGAALGLLGGGHGIESVARDASGYLAVWGIWTLALVKAPRLEWGPRVYHRIGAIVGLVTLLVLATKWATMRTDGEVLANYGVIDTAQLPVLLAYVAVVMARRSRHGLWWTLAFSASLVGLAITGTRTNLAALAGLPVLFLTGGMAAWPMRRRLAILGMPVLLGGALIAVQAPVVEGMQTRAETVSLTDFSEDESLAIRLSSYRQLTDRLNDSIALGEGLGSKVSARTLVRGDRGPTFTGDTSYASLIKFGVPGSALFLGALFLLWTGTYRLLDPDGRSLLIALTVFYVVVSPLRSVLDDPSLGLSMALLVGIFPSRTRRLLGHEVA